jgi:hypothetical protein
LRGLVAVVGSILILTACEWGATPDVLDQKTDGKVIYATTECVTPNSDGVRCDKKTCKKDADSDCKDFARACLNTGHQYTGTENEGTCDRVATNHAQ